MVWAQAERVLPLNIQLHRPRQEDEAKPNKAGGQEHTHGVPRLREGTKAYRLYDPCGDKVLVSHNIVFDEEVAWD